MDGVLLDNVAHHLEAWRRIGLENGKELTDQEIRATFGQRNQEMLQALIQADLSDEAAQRLADRKESLYREVVAGDLERAMVPGLRHFLLEIRRRGAKTAVATSGPIQNVTLVTEGLGIESQFDAFVTSADVQRGKPHPDVFLVAAQRLRLPPQRCVVFEDSTSGVQAALRAGCFCVAVATTHSETELRSLNPHCIVSDFRGLHFDPLVAELSAHG